MACIGLLMKQFNSKLLLIEIHEKIAHLNNEFNEMNF
jgi:hypothetical protein